MTTDHRENGLGHGKLVTKRKNQSCLAAMSFITVIAIGNYGCGGGSLRPLPSPATVTPTPPAPLSVSVSPASVALATSATQQFTATVANDPANKGVTWTVSCSPAPCGAVSPTSTQSGTATTYTPPIPPRSNLTVALTATSVSDSTKSASATIFFLPLQPLAITTTSLPTGVVNVPYSATIKSTGGTPPVSWTLDPDLPPGLSLSSGGIISGTPSAPGSGCFDVVANDSSAVPQSAAQGLCIGVESADTSHNALLNGHYAFLISGFKGPGEFGVLNQIATAGSFVADGMGNLTGGVFDSNNGQDDAAEVNQSFTGTYALGGDNRGTMSLVSSAGAVTLAFSVDSSGSATGAVTKGRIINFATLSYFMTNGPAPGEFDLQDVTAFSDSAIRGPYAFELSGWRSSQLGVAGVWTADGGSNIPTGNADTYEAATFTSNQSVTGTYGLQGGSSTGRGTAALTIGGTALNMIFYVVSASKLLIVGADQTPSANHNVFMGQALKQTGGPFKSGSLSGTTVFVSSGTGRLHNVTAGLAAFDGQRGVTFLQDQNDAGTITLDSTTTAAYSVSSDGRVTVTAGASVLSVFYLVSGSKGFILNPDGRTGFFEVQAVGPFTDSYISGPFFFSDLPPSCCTPVSSGVAALNTGIINLTYDVSQPGGSIFYDQTSMDTFKVSSNGRGTTGSGNEIIYIVSPTEFVMIDVKPGDTEPDIKLAEQ